MAELSDLQKKYGTGNLTPEQMIYMEQLRPKSGSEVAQRIIRESSPELQPDLNVLQRTAEGARIAGDLVNKYLPKALVVPEKYVQPSKLRTAVKETEVPTSFKFFPSVDTMTGEMRPAGFGEGRVKVGKVMEAIKPADLLGISSAERVYGNLGYGQAPEPMDVLDTIGLQAGMLQAGRAGFRGASTLAKAGAPYAAEGLTNLVSKYGVDPRMNITPDAPSMSDAVPEGFKLAQEGGKSVVYDASGKIFAKGDDAKSAIFRANKRLENEAANAARAARREERAAEAPVAEQKPLVKVETDENVELFYNPLKKAAANLSEETDPIKVLNELRTFENVTDDQIKFSGIDQYLESKAAMGEGTSLDEVRDFIDENRIKLYESYRDNGGKSGGYRPEDIEISDRDLNRQDPDDSYMAELVNNEEEWIRDSREDEIYEEVINRHPELNDEEIQERVDGIIRNLAYDAAENSYYDNPIYRAENDLGYVISGNRDQGYIVRGPNGQDIAPRRGYFDDLDEANEAIVEDARNQGLLMDEGKATLFGEDKYPAYLMPGGRNYRELNIGLEPGSKDKSAGRIRLYEVYMDRLEAEANEIRRQHPIINRRPPEVANRLEQIEDRIQMAADLRNNAKYNLDYGANAWYGTHFEDDPDLIAQLRLQDFDDVDGMSGALIDEAQSDMHQKGREKGYQGSWKEISEAKKIRNEAHAKFNEAATSILPLRVFDNFFVLLDEMNGRTEAGFFARLDERIVRNNNLDPNDQVAMPTPEEMEKIKELIKEARNVRALDAGVAKLESGIPDAPFKKDWYHIAIRRAIKDAIDRGLDRVYLPTGDALADRYNYAAAIDQIGYRIKDDGNYSITLKDFDGNWHQNLGNQSFSNVAPDELDGIFGKAMADKMRDRYADQKSVSQLTPSDTTYLIENQSIDVGGKGFKKYYDEVYPNFIKKEAKDFEANTGYTKIKTPVKNMRQQEKILKSEARKRKISVRDMQHEINMMSPDESRRFWQDREEPVFYIEINDAMRQAYGKGRPYARGGLVTDALDAVEEHFQKGGKVPAKEGGEAKNIEPVPLLGRLAGMLGESSEFLKSRPLKEEGSWQAKGAASAVNSALELVDQFFVNDLAKTADRMAYGFPVTSGKGETLKPLPETTGAVLTVAPPAAKLASKTARVVKNAAPLMEQATKQGAETVFDMLERYAPQPMYVVPKEESKFLPTVLPRTRRSPEEIEEHAVRVARQMSGEHVRNPRAPKDASNLAGRSMKESQRLQALPYTLEETKVLPAPDVVTPQAGSVKIALPGDITVSDKVLVDVAGRPIRSVQEGGPFFGQGKLHLPEDESLLWASERGPAQNFQNRVNEIAEKYGISEIDAHHLAMGPVATNFAMHFADANLKAINSGKVTKKSIQQINKLIRDGFQIKKGDDLISYKFKDFPGVENPDEAYKYLRGNSEARKWFNNRMKTPAVTEPLGLPNAQDIQWAISDPVLRNMEINLTGRSVGRTVPYAQLTDTAEHGTYGKGIRGRFKGTTEYPVPLELGFSDAWDFTKARKRPQDITGTLQKVFPHQVVDQQYLDEIGRYNELVRKYIGKKEGGVVGTVYSPKENLVFVGQEHGKAADLPEGIRQIAEKYGAYYEGSGGDKMPEMGYRGSWDDAAAKSVEGYPEEFLYTLFTNTDVNRQKDALKGKGSIFDSILKNQKKFGYFKDRAFDADTLRSFLSKMGEDVLSRSQMDASEENVRDFLSMGESLMWDRDDTEARRMADRANSFRQEWLLSQPSGVFFVGSDHIQDLKKEAQPVKKSRGGVINRRLPAGYPPQLPQNVRRITNFKKYENLTSNNQNLSADYRPLNFDALMKKGAVRVTHKGSDTGYDPNPSAGFSLVSAYNDAAGTQTRNWKDNPKMYGVVKEMMTTRPADIGAHKYLQIVESARDLGVPDDEIFLGGVRKKKGGKVKGIKITETYSIAPEASRPRLSRAEEQEFQRGVRGTKWFQQFSKKYGEPPDLNDPGYNYRAAWRAGLRPQDVKDDPEMQHWSSVTPSGESLKSRSHPTAWKEDYMQMTGRDPSEPGTLTPEQIEGMKRALMYRYSEK